MSSIANGVVMAGAVLAVMMKMNSQKKKESAKAAPLRESDVKELVIPPADDFHLHLRDGAVLKHTVPHITRQFKRAIIMPNLTPPVVNAAMALEYRARIMDAIKASDPAATFQPLMTLYLTDKTTPEMIREAKATGHVYACKLYPAGATTNSDSGVTDVTLVYPAMREMAKQGMPLLVHGEVTDQTVDIFDREAVFIERHLRPLIRAIPELKVVMEHVTTRDAVDFVNACDANVAATITAHHLLYNRNRLFVKGLNPHYYCLPILKAEEHRLALVAAATSGSPKFFAGTDSAPHASHKKEAACGCAGCYTAFAAVELYAEAFVKGGRPENLAKFMCENGANFYGLPKNRGKALRLLREEWEVPASFPFGDDVVVPLRSGEPMQWRLASD